MLFVSRLNLLIPTTIAAAVLSGPAMALAFASDAVPMQSSTQSAPPAAKPAGKPAAPAGKAAASGAAKTAGKAEPPATGAPAEDVVDIYFVPVKGQMGTDVHPSIYEDVIKDIKAKQPDVVCFVIDCADYNTIFYLRDDDPTKASLNKITEYRDMVAHIQEELEGFRQIVWVEDSVGFSSLVALSWPDLYMTSTARLQGLERVLEPVLSWRDPDVRAKMLAAWTGIAKGFLEKGGYPQELGEAMMRPEKLLSVSFEGRKLIWQPDTAGHWILDGSDKATARFSAQLAEDIGLCDGIADTKDDLAFLMGFREWREVPQSTKIVDDYVDDWRSTLEQASKWMLEFQDAMKYASGPDEVKYLGQAIARLEKIRGAMIKYPAIEIQWQRTRGLDRDRLQIEIEKLKERIRALKDTKGGSTGGGGGGGGGSLGGGRGR